MQGPVPFGDISPQVAHTAPSGDVTFSIRNISGPWPVSLPYFIPEKHNSSLRCGACDSLGQDYCFPRLSA